MLFRTSMILATLLCITTHVQASFWASTSTPSQCTTAHTGKKGNNCHTINVVTRHTDGSVNVNLTWHGYLPYVNMAVKNMNKSTKDSTRYCEVQLYNCETHGDCSSDRGVSLPPKDSRYALETCIEEGQGSSVKSEEVNVYGPVPNDYGPRPHDQAGRQSIWSSMYWFGLELCLAVVLAWHYSRFQNPLLFSFGLNGQR
jgi:hypothetical protein